MKKALIASLVLALATPLFASCGGDSSSNNNKKFSEIPTKADMQSIVDGMGKINAKGDLKPGTVEYCDAVADLLDEFDALNFASARYDDNALDAQASVLHDLILKCVANDKVDSFDWYLDGMSDVIDSCYVPAGIDMKKFYVDYKKVYVDYINQHKTKIDCADYNREMRKFMSDSSHAVAANFIMSLDCDDNDEKCEEQIGSCMSDWMSDAISSDAELEQLADAEEVLMTFCANDMFDMTVDPCVKKTCGAGEYCDGGECYDLCDDIDCGSNAKCVYGFCVSSESSTPVTEKSCKTDPSICTANQECGSDGKCKDKSSSGDACDNYPLTKDAFKAILVSTAPTCSDFVKLAATAELEKTPENCSEKWVLQWIADGTITASAMDRADEKAEECMDEW